LSKKNKYDPLICGKSDDSDFLVQDSRVRNYFAEKVKNCGDLEKNIISGYLKNKRERETGGSKKYDFIKLYNFFRNPCRKFRLNQKDRS
jgi:hypothetical protein